MFSPAPFLTRKSKVELSIFKVRFSFKFISLKLFFSFFVFFLK